MKPAITRAAASKDVIEAYIVQLTRDPSPLLKFGRNGKPGFRLFQLSSDLLSLTWQSTKKKDLQKVNFKDMKEVMFGQRTEKFKKANRPDLEQYSFSIIYFDDSLSSAPSGSSIGGNSCDTLDLVAKDEAEFQMWTLILSGLIEKKIDRTQYLSLTSSKDNDKTGPGGKKKSKISRNTREVMKEANDVYAFGWGEWGQNGLGAGQALGTDLETQTTPKLMEAMLGKHVVAIALGWSHAACLLDDGKILQYGNRIGTGFTDDVFLPSALPTPAGISIASISCGNYHTAALTETGQILTWGCGAQGQLGHGDRKDLSSPKIVDALLQTPMGLENFIVQVACGGNFTAALGDDGVVYTWGAADHGALGINNSSMDQLKPTSVKDLMGTDIQRICCGEAHMFAFASSSDQSYKQLYAWGYNGCGQLGLGHEEDQLRPHIVESLRGHEIKDIDAGAAHTVALVTVPKLNIDVIYSWGSNCCGQLGQGKKSKILKPLPMPDLKGDSPFIEVKCGAFHTILRTQTGELYSAGLNKFGQLGHCNTKDLEEFKLIDFLTEKNCRAVVCGGSNTAVLVPRAWVEDSEAKECMACRTAFTFVTRRHHCRNCGGIFCNNCSSKKMALLHLHVTEPVRVCNNCYTMLGGR